MNVTPADNVHFYEPAQGHGLKHDPFNAIVGPRPIGWIGSRGAKGNINLAPYSFFNAFNYKPPIIGFATVASRKDSLRNIEETGEFTWSLVTKHIAEHMNKTAAHVAPDVNEFDISGLTQAPSRFVKAPRVAEAYASFECKVTQIVQLQTKEHVQVPAWVVFGEVVAVYIEKSLIKDGVYQTADAHPILRAGRMGDYAEIRPDVMFEMVRPD